jgi:hypothetical protein
MSLKISNQIMTHDNNFNKTKLLIGKKCWQKMYFVICPMQLQCPT